MIDVAKTDDQLVLQLREQVDELRAALRNLTDECVCAGWPLRAEHMIPMNEARALLARLEGE